MVKITTHQYLRLRPAHVRRPDRHEQGRVLGHENLGQVIEVGPAVERLQGRRLGLHAVQRRLRLLQELREGLTAYCLTTNEPGMAGAAYGFADMGP